MELHVQFFCKSKTVLRIMYILFFFFKLKKERKKGKLYQEVKDFLRSTGLCQGLEWALESISFSSKQPLTHSTGVPRRGAA